MTYRSDMKDNNFNDEHVVISLDRYNNFLNHSKIVTNEYCEISVNGYVNVDGWGCALGLLTIDEGLKELAKINQDIVDEHKKKYDSLYEKNNTITEELEKIKKNKFYKILNKLGWI